jgi:hypothetical protein
MSADLCQAAMDCLRWGFAVFPLHYPVERNGALLCSCGSPKCGDTAAKHPYGRHAPKGLLNASKDPAIVERWWGAGTPYNIGGVTGEVSGSSPSTLIHAIAVTKRWSDSNNDLARCRELGGFSPAPASTSCSNTLVGGCGASSIGPGIDCRGDGSYIVTPGSRHITGRRYAVDVDHHPDDCELAELPAWLATMVLAPVKAAATQAAELPENWRKLVADGVSEGKRNEAVARLAGDLLRKRVDPFVILDLCRIWNKGRCRPPLDDGEIIKTVNSICAREFERRGEPYVG